MKYSGRKDRWKRKGKRNVYCQTNLHEHIKNYFCKFLFLYTYFLDKIFLNLILKNLKSKSWKSFENHFTIFNSIVSSRFDETNSKIFKWECKIKSNTWKNYFKIQTYIKKRNLRTKPHPQTSSFSVKHLQTRIAIYFSPPRDRDRPIHTTKSRHIVCRKIKKKKRKISSEKEHDPVTEPSHDRHFHSRGGSCARCPVSSIPETNIQGFLKSGRCLPWKSITSATRCVTLKPLKQGTLLITCYPAVYDQRSPRKIFGKRIETYTSDTLSKRHCVAVYLPSVAHEGRGGC